MNIAEQLRGTNRPCNEILNAGSIILVGLLENCGKEPIVHNLFLQAAIAVLAETVELISDRAEGTYLREGAVLHFGTASIVVTADTLVVSTPTTVPIEPATVAVATGASAETWALLKILSPTNIPLNLEGETVDRTDLNSIQGAMVKTGINFKPQIQAIASRHDRALWTTIFEGANSTADIYAHIIYSSDQNALGRALVSNYNTDGANKEIQRPQFTLDFQGKDYAVTKPWAYESIANQTLINGAMKLSGMNIYS